ncbi:MAG: hypothetical protein ACE141_16325, partial [Bryobacteraceae bacterium]
EKTPQPGVVLARVPPLVCRSLRADQLREEETVNQILRRLPEGERTMPPVWRGRCLISGREAGGRQGR